MNKIYRFTGVCRPEFSGRDHNLTVVVEAPNMDTGRRLAHKQASAAYDDVSIFTGQQAPEAKPFMQAVLPDARG